MVQIFFLKQPVQQDSVRSCAVPKLWASSFVDLWDHCRSVFEKVELDWVWTVGNVVWYVVNWLKKQNCQNVGETEWPFRDYDAPGFPWVPTG